MREIGSGDEPHGRVHEGRRVPLIRLLLPIPLLMVACGGGPADEPPGPPALPEAPWAGEPLPPVEAPEVLLQQWTRAENRRSCAAVSPAEGRPAEASPRAATFGGGWGVAWDLPDQRSAFGVAGTGVEPDAQTYDDWPHTREWADGSRVGYGPEGGTGPNQLAYLRIVGQACLYNVWSRLGVEHLESLLESLRFVETGALEGRPGAGMPGTGARGRRGPERRVRAPGRGGRGFTRATPDWRMVYAAP